VTTDPLIGAPDSDSWWDVPVSQVSELQSTRAASAQYEESKKAQRPYLAPVEGDS
jgi:3D-(3,5/4)-trihydroxycyclohexane-1,2-dione acylhydrolase (decyclizing)